MSPPRARRCAEAQARAYDAIARIDWPDGFCRKDIGWRATRARRAIPRHDAVACALLFGAGLTASRSTEKWRTISGASGDARFPLRPQDHRLGERRPLDCIGGGHLSRRDGWNGAAEEETPNARAVAERACAARQPCRRQRHPARHKLFLGRRRPRDDFEHGLYGFLYFTWQLQYDSFPSGHALTIFCVATWARRRPRSGRYGSPCVRSLAHARDVDRAFPG